MARRRTSPSSAFASPRVSLHTSRCHRITGWVNSPLRRQSLRPWSHSSSGCIGPLTTVLMGQIFSYAQARCPGKSSLRQCVDCARRDPQCQHRPFPSTASKSSTDATVRCWFHRPISASSFVPSLRTLRRLPWKDWMIFADSTKAASRCEAGLIVLATSWPIKVSSGSPWTAAAPSCSAETPPSSRPA